MEPSAASPALSVVVFSFIVMRIWAIIAWSSLNLSTPLGSVQSFNAGGHVLVFAPQQ